MDVDLQQVNDPSSWAAHPRGLLHLFGRPRDTRGGLGQYSAGLINIVCSYTHEKRPWVTCCSAEVARRSASRPRRGRDKRLETDMTSLFVRPRPIVQSYSI